MNWISEWKAISNRINGLTTAVQFFVQFDQVDSRGTIQNVLLPQTIEIYEHIQRYHEAHTISLPPEAQKCIKRYLELDEDKIKDIKATASSLIQVTQHEMLKCLVTSLIALQAELNFHLSDTQFVIRRITERAFAHLQRLIITDETVKKRWKESFDTHETECEKLGAAHLLLHGIWAFKANAEKGRTDLILGEPPNLNQVELTSEGLVLTEWKLVKNKKENKKKADEAYLQAKNYYGGILAGIELRNYCYLVLVSDKYLEPPKDKFEGDITFKYINLAVSPDIPSVSSKRS